jgi:hypothetical protein
VIDQQIVQPLRLCPFLESHLHVKLDDTLTHEHANEM